MKDQREGTLGNLFSDIDVMETFDLANVTDNNICQTQIDQRPSFLESLDC